jgi:hypothetical protein
MNLAVHDQEGVLVIDLEVDAIDPDATHIAGELTPGPGFDHLMALHDAFEAVYATGDLERAAQLHAAIDQLDLVATSPDGTRYAVSNVYLQGASMQCSLTRA